MPVRYSTNWMGPVNKQWYEERGLELWTYAAGRIDCRGEDLGQFGAEIGVDPMKDESWARFGNWLNTVETDDMWTMDQLVEMYERNNPKIEWWTDD